MTPQPTQTPTEPGTPAPSATGALTAIGEVMKNKYVAAVVGLLIAVAATLQGMSVGQAVHLPQGVNVACGVILGVGAFLGMYSPGARKAALLVLAVLFIGASSSCATLSSAEKAQLIDCGEKAAAAAASSMAPQLGGILAGNNPNWNADVGDLVVAGGTGAICALEVVIANLEQGKLVTADIGGAGAEPASPLLVSADVALSRANAVKARLNYRVK